MGPAPAPQTPEICEEKAQLERSYKDAEAAFDSAGTVLRQKLGRSSRAEYLTLVDAVDQAWDRLKDARSKLARHLREHGCGIIQEDPPSFRSIW